MSRDKIEADQLASPHLVRSQHRGTIGTAALYGLRWAAAFGEAVANGGRAWQAPGAKRVNGRPYRSCYCPQIQEPRILKGSIRLLISVAFALAVATSAEAMSPESLHEPDAMITQITDKPCNLPGQVRINGICMLRSTPDPVPQPPIYKPSQVDQPCNVPGQVRINGICMLRSTPDPVPQPPIHKPSQVDQPCNVPGQVRINGICMLRSTPEPVRQRDYRGCAKWNEGICVEYY